MRIDAVDRRILALLQEDASISVAEMAERTGLSASPCWRRVQRLEQAGIIRKRLAILDRHRLGLGVLVFVHVKLSANGRQSLAEFETAIGTLPEVLECHTTMGEVDFILKVVARDIQSFERFYRERLSALPGVRDFSSTIVMSNVKETTALPLAQAGIDD